MRSILFAVLLAFSGAVSPATGPAPAILIFGDSLSAAYGIPESAGWVALLGERLKQRNMNYTVVNASISGETSAGGAARIGKALAEHKPSIVVVELGANDGLRGLPVTEMKKNLTAIVQSSKRERARVVLIGMQLPPNYGVPYVNQFRAVFADIAKEERVPFVPFFLEGLDQRDQFQADNLHPTAKAQPILLETVWKRIATLALQGPTR